MFKNISIKAKKVYDCALSVAARIGKYPSKSELVREAIRHYLKEKFGIVINEYENVLEYEENGEKKKVVCE
ncbi:MAG: ribbon-helix-helix protein, CopG family [Thermococcus sp.]